ncbi:MAG TPA: DASS family sodium-coupled anion symporter, partial [Phycisphaerales bacterium]|nr:DASS family sodium-coupled anion symporter [Phycisphaerales bacterium]
AALAVYWLLPAEGAGVAAGLTPAGRMTLAVGAWLAVWWVTEAIAIEAAAMLPLALFPLLGVATMKEAAAPYAEEVVFLFLGGMLLGAAMERWHLHQRVALVVMLALGASPPRLIAGLLVSTAIISMWVSNTAAAIMMLPIAVGVISLAHTQHEELGLSREDKAARNFAVACLLAVAYGASIGGTATIIGSPPNGVMVGFASTKLGETVTFGEWMRVGLPVMLVTLPVTWLLLLSLYNPRGLQVSGAREMLRMRLRELGPLSRGEIAVLGVFTSAAAAWIFRVQLADVLQLTRERNGKTEVLLTDAGIAIIAAMSLFLIPISWKRGEFALDWKTAGKIPWGILLLFGGGLSLAAAISANHVDDYLGKLFEGMSGLPTIAIIAIIAASAIFVSEIGSNTAVATVMLPVVATVAPVLGVHVMPLCFAIALGVSLAFMMPSGTPPNALVFTSGHLRVREMVKAGFLLNVACIVIITLACYWLVPTPAGAQ